MVENAADHHAGACIDLQEQWKHAGPAPRNREEELWNRFRDACDRFFKKLDAEREENVKAKEKLCAEIDALVNTLDESSDRDAVARQIIELQQRWKAAGPAPRDHEDELWNRFRAPCDKFFEERRRQFQEIADEKERHLAVKQDLLLQAEALKDSDDWRGAGDAIRDLQTQWKQTGPGPKDEEENVWNDFQSACNHFFSRRDEHFAKMDKRRLENLKARERLLAELEKLVGGLDEDAPTADDGMSLAEELALAIETNFVKASKGRSSQDDVRRIQDEWKRIGSIPYEFEKQIRSRYKKLLDKFYEENR